MATTSPQDSRGYWMLPQTPEGSGYYTYGTPAAGQAQYAHPQLLSLLFLVEAQWSVLDKRRFGVGNISLLNGSIFQPHTSHRGGLSVDVRPLRRDGNHIGVRYFDQQYDQEATKNLINRFFQTGMVSRVFFNDLSISRVTPLMGHDDHFHIDVIV